jgi:superoxide dismutase
MKKPNGSSVKQIQIYFLLFLFITLQNKVVAQAKFVLPPLTYSYNALEPIIDAQTMEIHYSKHHQAYVNNLNKALENEKINTQNLTLEDLMKNISNYSAAIRNNGGGHYNHSLFWTILTPKKNTQPSKRLLDAIVNQFGSLDSLKKLINKEALNRFGSGWAWLSVDNNRKLFVSSTTNQDNPLMDIVEKRGTPILGIDVWEHAYYLKYQNKRNDYLTAIWDVINWEEVSKRYELIVPKGRFDDWPEIKNFHQIMSQTFHPSEEGNLNPIKNRIDEMVLKADELAKSTIPSEFNTKEVKKAIQLLVTDSKKLQKLIKNKGSDESIKKLLGKLHDEFHTIIGLCQNEEK